MQMTQRTPLWRSETVKNQECFIILRSTAQSRAENPIKSISTEMNRWESVKLIISLSHSSNILPANAATFNRIEIA